MASPQRQKRRHVKLRSRQLYQSPSVKVANNFSALLLWRVFASGFSATLYFGIKQMSNHFEQVMIVYFLLPATMATVWVFSGKNPQQHANKNYNKNNNDVNIARTCLWVKSSWYLRWRLIAKNQPTLTLHYRCKTIQQTRLLQKIFEMNCNVSTNVATLAM